MSGIVESSFILSFFPKKSCVQPNICIHLACFITVLFSPLPSSILDPPTSYHPLPPLYLPLPPLPSPPPTPFSTPFQASTQTTHSLREHSTQQFLSKKRHARLSPRGCDRGSKGSGNFSPHRTSRAYQGSRNRRKFWARDTEHGEYGHSRDTSEQEKEDVGPCPQWQGTLQVSVHIRGGEGEKMKR